MYTVYGLKKSSGFVCSFPRIPSEQLKILLTNEVRLTGYTCAENGRSKADRLKEKPVPQVPRVPTHPLASCKKHIQIENNTSGECTPEISMGRRGMAPISTWVTMYIRRPSRWCHPLKYMLQ